MSLVVYKGKKQTKRVSKVLIVKSKNRRSNISRSLTSGKTSPFGQTFTRNFRYVDQLSITSGLYSGVTSIRTNSMFDPDFTNVGHQPLFRDVLSSIYSKYIVNSMKYKITALSNNVDNYKWGVIVTQDTTYNPAVELFEANLEKRNMTNWRYEKVSSGSPNTISGMIHNHKVVGLSKNAYHSEEAYSALVGTNNALPIFLSIIQQERAGGSTTQLYMVELEYNTTYSVPLVQPQS